MVGWAFHHSREPPWFAQMIAWVQAMACVSCQGLDCFCFYKGMLWYLQAKICIMISRKTSKPNFQKTKKPKIEFPPGHTIQPKIHASKSSRWDFHYQKTLQMHDYMFKILENMWLSCQW